MSFDALWTTVRPKLFGVLARYGIPPEDGEDLIQTVFIQYLRKQHSVRKPMRWLLGSLANLCRMHWRTRGRSFTVAVDQALLEVLAEERAPEQERRVVRGELTQVVKKLKENCRRILKMRYLGYDRHEIAVQTGYKLSGIDKISKRCVEALSKRFRAAASGLRRASGRHRSKASAPEAQETPAGKRGKRDKDAP